MERIHVNIRTEQHKTELVGPTRRKACSAGPDRAQSLVAQAQDGAK